MKYNYSIIIPHHNTPQLLQRCIESIPIREDIQIIVVDDNSNNCIPQTCLLSNRNIEFYYLKERKGAGFARNYGITKAKAHWLMFADADDYYGKSIEAILDKYSSVKNVDMVFLNAIAIDNNNKTIPLVLNKYIDNYVNNRFLSLEVLRFQTWTPWSRIIKKDIVISNNIKFEEIPVGNDVMFILECSMHSSSFCVEKDIVYYYYKPSEGSQTSKQYTSATYSLRLEQKFKINNLYRRVNYPFQWPIYYVFHNKELNKLNPNKDIFLKYNYSVVKDFWNSLKYFLGKISNII